MTYGHQAPNVPMSWYWCSTCARNYYADLLSRNDCPVCSTAGRLLEYAEAEEEPV